MGDQSQLLIRLAGGAHPSTTRIFGKTQAYALVLSNCRNVTMKGLSFFATTIGIWKPSSGVDMGGSQLEDCSFKYPKASRRPLRQTEVFGPMQPQHLVEDCNCVSYFQVNQNRIIGCQVLKGDDSDTCNFLDVWW